MICAQASSVCVTVPLMALKTTLEITVGLHNQWFLTTRAAINITCPPTKSQYDNAFRTQSNVSSSFSSKKLEMIALRSVIDIGKKITLLPASFSGLIFLQERFWAYIKVSIIQIMKFFNNALITHSITSSICEILKIFKGTVCKK